MDKKSQIKIGIIFLIVLTILSALVLAFSFNTDKETYNIGEKVKLIVTPNDSDMIEITKKGDLK